MFAAADWPHPLAHWLGACLDMTGLRHANRPPSSCLNYAQLCNGALLNDVFLYIDPRACNEKVVACDESDVCGRLSNLSTLLRNMQSFYQDVLRQLVVMSLPDLLAIARQPFPDGSGGEMKKVLLLLLGCAVQSDKKEEFIERIKQLELSLQESIVQHIQLVTNNSECVINVQALELDPDDQFTTTVLHQLQRVVNERDTFAQTMLELCHEQESDSSSGASLCNGDVCARKLPEALQHDARSRSPASTERQHLGVELATARAELRKARNELEEKGELVAELAASVARAEADVARHEADRAELVREARAATDARDEIDALHFKLAKMERIEAENNKYRERLSELEFFRSRIEELRSENHILLETRTVLEEQLDGWKRRAQQHTDAETSWLESQRSLVQLQNQLRLERARATEAEAERERLERECRRETERAADLQERLDTDAAPSTPRAHAGTLDAQLNESTHKRLLELELENSKLRSQLDQAAETSSAPAPCANCADLESSVTHLRRQSSESEVEKEALAERCRVDVESSRAEGHRLERALEEAREKFSKVQSQLDADLIAKFERQLSESEARQADATRETEEARAECRQSSSELARVRAELKDLLEQHFESEQRRLSLEHTADALDRSSKVREKENSLLKTRLESVEGELDEARCRLVQVELDERRLKQTSAAADADKERLAQQVAVEQQKATQLADALRCADNDARTANVRLRAIGSAFGVGAECSEVDAAALRIWQATQRDLAEQRADLDRRDGEAAVLREEVALLEERLRAAELGGDEESSERNALQEENRNVREQVAILQARLRTLQNELCAKEAELQRLRSELAQLKSQLSSERDAWLERERLEARLRNGEMQEELLRADNEELQKQAAGANEQQSLLRADLERLQQLHAALLTDHDRLQRLHAQLSADYERATRAAHDARVRQREVRAADSELALCRHRADKERRSHEETKALLASERCARDADARALALVQNEQAELRRAHDDAQRAAATNAAAVGRARHDAQTADLRATRLAGQVAEVQQAVAQKELELARLGHKSDMEEELRGTLKDECRTLLRQMEMLMTQNQELLARALLDKEHHHAEEKELQDKLTSLRRQKEKLEEKIIEQYRSMDNSPPVVRPRMDKPTLVKRAAKALIPRTPTRKGRSGGSSTGEESSALSADEGGFLQAHHRRARPHVNGQPIEDSNYVNLEVLDKQNVVPDVVPKFIEHASLAEAAPSGRSSASTQPDSLSPELNPADARISWTGSERPVDVAVPSGLRVPPPLRTSRSPVPPSPPAYDRLPPPTRPRGHSVASRAPPPPYPSAAKPPAPPGAVQRHRRVGAPRSRPPPPPYPAAVSLSPRSKREVSRVRTNGSLHYSATEAASTGGDTSAESFAPAQTSTPDSQRPPFAFRIARRLSTDAGSGDGGGVCAKFPDDRVDYPSPPTRHALADRQDVLSIYENVEDLCDVERIEHADETAGTLLTQVAGENKSAIWYEYGCI